MSVATTVARARYELDVSRSPRDVARFATSLVLPAHVVANLGAESPWTGVPRALGARGRRAVRRGVPAAGLRGGRDS
jgi:hypothetical protein